MSKIAVESASYIQHIAIIMDGNGRWAKKRNLPRISGHNNGAQTIHKVIETCLKEDIPYLTLYAFSSENWQRPADEIKGLMELLSLYLSKEVNSLQTHGVKLNFIGDLEKLSKNIHTKILEAEHITKDNTNLTLTIAVSYGGRQEIISAIKAILENKKIEDFTEEDFKQYLNTANIPDPDLLIRTGGEKRLSNFLLWQLAYTELFFTDTLWPDFSEEDLMQAIDDYRLRERRYGSF